MPADSDRDAENANAIGGYMDRIFEVRGFMLDLPIAMRFRARNRDEAIKQAHDRSITVKTCEIAKPCPTNATRR